MRQFLIIPDRSYLEECLELAAKYNLGFEYNDFFNPDILDDAEKLSEIMNHYKKYKLPEYTTLHGAFFDVLPFSVDERIRRISDERIRQSLTVARQIGAGAVVFHTNYNPFLNAESYIKPWIQTNIAYWSGILEEFPDVNIYLENMFDTTPDLMVTLSEALCKYSNYGVCLDYAHASLSEVAPEIWAERLGRYVKHVHINDNDLVSDLHLAWGDGKINRSHFYECCEKYMKNATILIETSSMKSKVNSLEVLKKDGFI